METERKDYPVIVYMLGTRRFWITGRSDNPSDHSRIHEVEVMLEALGYTEYQRYPRQTQRDAQVMKRDLKKKMSDKKGLNLIWKNPPQLQDYNKNKEAYIKEYRVLANE